MSLRCIPSASISCAEIASKKLERQPFSKMYLKGARCGCSGQTIHLKSESMKIQPQNLALRGQKGTYGGTDTSKLSLDASLRVSGLLMTPPSPILHLFLVDYLRSALISPQETSLEHVQDFYCKVRDLTYCFSLHPGSDLDSRKAFLAVEVGILEIQQLVRAVHQNGWLSPCLPLLPRRTCGNSSTRQCIQAGPKKSPFWAGGPGHGL